MAALHLNLSWLTAKRRAERYVAMGRDGMVHRSSRPHSSPTKTNPALVRRIGHLRWRQPLGPIEIGAKLGMPASTVHSVLVRCWLNRLRYIDKRTGEIVRRYEHDHPGSMIHVDVTKFGNIPDGGGRRYVGRQQGKRNRASTVEAKRNDRRQPLLGTEFVNTAIDDHSRVVHADPRPTGRPNGSIALSPIGGPTAGTATANRPAETLSRHGSTNTITTVAPAVRRKPPQGRWSGIGVKIRIELAHRGAPRRIRTFASASGGQCSIP